MRRDHATRYQKGHAPSKPRGAISKARREARDLARDLAPEAIKRLGTLMRSVKTEEGTKLEAIKIILDRAYGRPVTPVAHAHSVDLSRLTDDEFDVLRGISDRLASGAGPRPTGSSQTLLPPPAGSNGAKH